MPALVTFTVRGLGLAPALPGTYLGFEWKWFGWDQPRLLKVLNQDPDPQEDTPSITFTCFDCQRFVDDPVVLPSPVVPTNRRRVRTPKPTVDLTPPGPASGLSATGSFRQIVLRWTAPRDLDYLYTEIWASGTNNRATAVRVRNSAIGAPGQQHEEIFNVADAQAYRVWLMTVDRTGNGANGSGNWFPTSATGGFFAQASLVPTQALEPDAVTFAHPTQSSGQPGTYSGETVVAISQLGGAFQQGLVQGYSTVFVQVVSIGTAIAQIRRASPSGAVIGINYVTNALNVAASIRVDAQGIDFAPAWNGLYYSTIQVLNQSGAQVPFVLGANAGLFIVHTKA
jgi:hypothetical protein